MGIHWSPHVGWSTAGASLCLGIAALGLGIQAQATPASVIRARVTLAGVPMSGRTPAEVESFAAELAARLLRHPLQVQSGKQTELTTAAQLGATCDAKAAAAAVIGASEELGTWMDRIKGVFVGPPAADVPLTLSLTDADVRRGLARFSVRIGAEPRNPRYLRTDGSVKIIPARQGKELHPGLLREQVAAALADPELGAAVTAGIAEQADRTAWLKSRKPLRLTATLRTAYPRVKLEHLKELSAGLASFSTSLSGSSGRIHNIRLACRAIDGIVLLPGDVFSYNETVGPRVPSAGYRNAPVIVQGQLQTGTGGGVCQVSSTLYNAALLADLEIVKRSHHAFPVKYVPAGRDATVWDGMIDFQFKNRFKHPIALDAKIKGSRVWFHVYGHPEDRREVEIVRGGIHYNRSGGISVTVSRVVRTNDAVLRREVVSSDYYRPPAAPVRVAAPRGSARVTTRIRSRRGARLSRASWSSAPTASPVSTAPAPVPASAGGGDDSGL